MPKYGGVGGQGGAVVFKAKELATLRKMWREHPNKTVKSSLPDIQK